VTGAALAGAAQAETITFDKDQGRQRRLVRRLRVWGHPPAHASFGWPLLAAGSVKIAYDLLLLVYFGKVRPPEERTEPAGAD